MSICPLNSNNKFNLCYFDLNKAVDNPYIKVKGCLCVCLYRRISLTGFEITSINLKSKSPEICLFSSELFSIIEKYNKKKNHAFRKNKELFIGEAT